MRQFLPITLLLCLFLSSPLLSQPHELTGTVIDAGTRQPLKGANVYLVKSRRGTETGEDGRFHLVLEFPIPGDTLVIGFVGYADYRAALADYADGSTVALKPLTIREDSIVVRAHRIDLVKQEIPHAGTAITLQTIELRGTSEIGDLFKTVPSVRIEGNDISGRRIQIRGSDPAEVNVYVDGILINNVGLDNAADLSILSPESIERIDVLKGPNLTLLGSGAFGGVVNIITRRDQQRRVLLKGKVGSFRSRYLVGDVAFPIGRRILLNYFGQFNTLKPEIEYFPGEQYSDKTPGKQIDTQKQNHHLSFTYYLNAGEFSSRFIGYFLDYRRPFRRTDRRNFLWVNSYTGSLLGIPEVDIKVNYLYSDDTVELQDARQSEVRDVSSLLTRRLDVKLLKKFVADRNEFQVLAEYFHDELDRRTDRRQGASPALALYRAGLYDNRWSLAAVLAFRNAVNDLEYLTWKTHLGFREELLATGKSYFLPTAGIQVVYDRAPWRIAPYINWGKNAHFPTLLDNAFVRLQQVDGSDSTRLQPEFSNAAEIGVRAVYRPGALSFEEVEMSLSFFRNRIFNKLLRRPNEPLTVNSQVGRNLTTGVEGVIILRRLFRRVNLSTTFNVLNISNPLLYAYKPEGGYSFQAEYFSGMGLRLSATYFYEGQSVAWFYDTGGNLVTRTIAPFHDLDVSVGYRLHLGKAQAQVQITGNNVFDNSGFRDFLLKKRFWQVALSVKL